MKTKVFRNTAITVLILITSFIICLVLNSIFKTPALIPSIFILGVFLTSVLTDGYIYGFASSIISVFTVNIAFTFPYFKLNFSISINLVSAIIMVIISLTTCTITAKFKESEAIKADSEREKMRANLLRAVSHDLRTPLTAIYGASQTLLESKEQLSEKQKDKMLSGIRDDSRWLSRLVENLLSITKLNNSELQIIKTSIALDELIDSVLVKFKKRYPNHKVNIEMPDDFVSIPMDALLVEQVLLNILENAVQHSIGMTTLTLRIYLQDKLAHFEIQDNGCGINEEKLKTIFTGCYTSPNYTSDSSRNNAGIGLSVCATIIKAHGSEIKVKNLKEGGCVFSFALDTEDMEEIYE